MNALRHEGMNPSLKSNTKVTQEFSSTQENERIGNASQERVDKTKNQRHITVQEITDKNV